MHRIPSPNSAPSPSRGFSLPEVAISLAVLSVAFVSLFALLPYGLTSFRASVDTANETWIMQGINSMIQTTEWEEIWGPNATITDEVYYFDEEGRLTDTESNPSNDPIIRRARLYQAKLFVLPFFRPGASSASDAFVAIDSGAGASEPIAIRVIAVMANVSNAQAVKTFDELQSAEQIDTLPKNSGLVVRSFVATRMNSVR